MRNWLVGRLPPVAEAATGVIVHPTVGKLVGAASAALMAEFEQRSESAQPPDGREPSSPALQPGPAAVPASPFGPDNQKPGPRAHWL